MAAAISANPPLSSESKTGRKKKAKTALATPDEERSNSVAGLDGDGRQPSSDGGFENAYVKELQKQMRNVTKKLNATQRVDKIVDDNPDRTLDQLVTAKLINLDQKAQALKKPALQAQLSSLEEQVIQYKKFDTEYHDAMAKERELLKSSHATELEEMRDAERKVTRVEMEKEFRLRMLTFGRFLKAAAARRQDENVEPDEEGKAFEGVLSNVYTGDVSAVEAIEKLITGSEEKVRDFNGQLDVTYARIKALSIEEAPVVDEDPWSGAERFVEREESSTAHEPEGSDPTITHAGLTELESQIPILNGTAHIGTPAAPATGSITADGNAAAEEQWDTKVPGEAGMDESFEIIPRDPQEVDNKEGNAPAPVTSTQSWADEAQDAAQITTPSGGVDGFHEVHHRGRGRGGARGGFFGEGRGRSGRGGRGFRGGSRGGGGGERGRGRGNTKGERGD